MKAAKSIDDNDLRILDDLNSRPPSRNELEDEGSMNRIVVSSCPATCYIELVSYPVTPNGVEHADSFKPPKGVQEGDLSGNA